MRRLFKPHGMTLIELVMAIVLLNIVILTGISIEMGMRRIFTSTDVEAQLLGDAGPILSLLSRAVTAAIGDARSGFNAYRVVTSGSNTALYVYADAGTLGIRDAGDRPILFNLSSAGVGQPRFYYSANTSTGVSEMLSSHVAAFNVSLNSTSGLLNIAMDLRQNISQAVGVTNPGAIVTTRLRSRCATWQ
jgi:type II secretory pathway pseudopilin PulG